MEQTIYKDGKTLRLGYTTGSCAAAAAKAAAFMLLTGTERRQISLLTPKGIRLELEVLEITRTADCVSCAIRKDGGDDPDTTHGALVFAQVSRSDVPGIAIDGGVGVGRVTKRGLDQPVGNAAINSTPRRMITENLQEVCQLADYRGGLSVLISIPEGEALAKKTFNPRLGIVGGISVLGTTGIVEPMSEQALIDTIQVELRQHRALGEDYVLLTPGNYGKEFIQMGLHLDADRAVQVSNFIGDALDLCRDLGFKGALLVGHIGKLVKIGGGMLNTHSKYGDCRMEILAAHGAGAGLPAEQIPALLDCATCDEGLRILREAGCDQAALHTLIEKIAFHLQRRAGDTLETAALLFSRETGLVGQTPNAQALLHHLTEV